MPRPSRPNVQALTDATENATTSKLAPLPRERVRSLDETRRGLLKARNRVRYDYTPREAEAFVAGISHLAAMVVAEPPVIDLVCRDPDDDHVLAAALAADADCIVTGDADLLSLGSYGRIRILSVRAFLAEV